MICPKCQKEIKDSELICPHCQKVLKVQCPRCGTIGTSRLCEECGHMILVKCYRCQKINHTSLAKCPRCGFNTAASISLRESLIDEFASLTIEFENKNLLNDVFENKKQLAVFNKNLHLMIKNLAIKNDVRLQNVGNFLIIRFCKNSNFQESVENAISFAIEVAQNITDINYKLEKAKGVHLSVRMSVQKRDANSPDTNYKSGVNIKLLYDSKEIPSLISNIQIIVDFYIYQALCKKYAFQALTSVFVKNELIMLYELKLKRLIKIHKEEKEDLNDIDSFIKNLSKDVDYMPVEADDENKLFKFAEVKAHFKKVKNTELKSNLLFEIRNNKNNFIVVKSDNRYGKFNLLSFNDIEEITFGFYNYRFSCFENLKYIPFGFWRELLLSFYNTDVYSLNLPEKLGINDIILPPNDNLKNLLFKNFKEINDFENNKYLIADALLDFFSNIKEQTIFVVDDIEYIDESSLEILTYLINNCAFNNVIFLFSCDESFSLHSKIVKLIRMDNYTELELKPVSNKEILTKYKAELSEISTSFAFNKLLEMTYGAEFYFKKALNYLLNDKFLIYKNNKFEIFENKMIVFAQNIEEIFSKEILLLSQNKELFNLFVLISNLGYKVPVKMLEVLEIKELDNKLNMLKSSDFVDVRDGYIFVKNYNLVRKILNNFVESKQLLDILLPVQKLLSSVSYPFYLSAIIKELISLDINSANEFEKHANIAKNFGDFPAYLLCMKKYLEIFNIIPVVSEEFSKGLVEKGKYEEIIDLLYHYYPEKVVMYLHLLLQQAEDENNDKNIKKYSNQLLQCSILNENYTYATVYLNKILSRSVDVSLNPNHKNFDIKFLIANMVKIEIYHILGRLNECVSVGVDILKDITPKIYDLFDLNKFEKKEFISVLEETVFSVVLSGLIKFTPEFKKILKKLSVIFACRPLYFDIAETFYDFIKGVNVDLKIADFENADISEDKYSQIILGLFKIVKALKSMDWIELSNQAYATKLIVQNEKIQFVYFCDLMIAYSYKQMGNFSKAEQIYQNIYQKACDSSLTYIKYLTIYLLSDLATEENNYSKSVKYIDSLILNLEGDENTSDLLLMFFKGLLAKNLLVLNDKDKALYCAKNACELAKKMQLKEYEEEYKKLTF